MKIIVAKDGVNALTATNPNDFIFHSEYNTLKILEQGTDAVVLSDTGGLEDTHTVSVQTTSPFVFAFCQFNEFAPLFRVGPPGTKDASGDFWFTSVEVSGTDILFNYVNDTGGNYNATFIYIVCELPI